MLALLSLEMELGWSVGGGCGGGGGGGGGGGEVECGCCVYEIMRGKLRSRMWELEVRSPCALSGEVSMTAHTQEA